MNDPVHAAGRAAWTQLVQNAPAFQIAPPRGSAEARDMLAASIENRENGTFREGRQAPRPIAAHRNAAEAAVNQAKIRFAFLFNRIAFVRQVDWGSGASRPPPSP